MLKTYGGWEDGESARSTAGCVGPALWEASSDSEGIQGLSCEMDKLDSRSVSNEEFVLDVPFSVEEVATAVRKLKGGKVAGPDGLTAEYLKEIGDVMVIWLVNILNAVVDLEVVPSTLKSGIVVPVVVRIQYLWTATGV